MKKKMELIESAEFLIPVMMTGGFMDAYTYITRDGVFANNQTGNVARLGIVLFQGEWIKAFETIVPILAAILGAIVASKLKKASLNKNPGQWHESILLLEAIMFIIVGFAPSTFPNIVINSFMTFISTFQLTGFRTLDGMVCNTTISTGNLRSIGQLWGESFDKKDNPSTKKAAKYTFVVATFVLGSFIGAVASTILAGYAIWICALLLLSLRTWMKLSPKG